MEVSPRDGLQNEDTLLTTEQKLQLIDHALDAGCKRIEVTSFVHPKRVPQMADAEAVCAGLPERADVRYTGLILNDRGYQRLRDTKLHEAGLVVPATDTFGDNNQGLSVAQGLSMAVEIIAVRLLVPCSPCRRSRSSGRRCPPGRSGPCRRPWARSCR